jgi:hypothetical protein
MVGIIARLQSHDSSGIENPWNLVVGNHAILTRCPINHSPKMTRVDG